MSILFDTRVAHWKCGHCSTDVPRPMHMDTTLYTEKCEHCGLMPFVPSGQAASSPANGTFEDRCECCGADRATCGGTLEGFCPGCHRVHAKRVNDARFHERVACAALVLKASTASIRPTSDQDWLTHIAEAILARGAK